MGYEGETNFVSAYADLSLLYERLSIINYVFVVPIVLSAKARWPDTR